jgi:hypothetical protein
MKTNVQDMGDRQHSHMLGAGRAWFEGTYPNEWASLKSVPAEQAIDRMCAIMDGTYVKLFLGEKDN